MPPGKRPTVPPAEAITDASTVSFSDWKHNSFPNPYSITGLLSEDRSIAVVDQFEGGGPGGEGLGAGGRTYSADIEARFGARPLDDFR